MPAENLLDQIRKQFGYDAEAITAAQSATRGEAAARAGAYQQNAALLRFDASQYQQVGGEVFESEFRQGLQRAASAAGQYAASGVRVEGSARAVVGEISRESLEEAKSQRNKYIYEARRAQKQADIQDYYAGLELQAGEYEAQSIQRQAAASFEAAKQRYLGENLSKYLQAIAVNPLSFKAAEASLAINQYRDIAALTLDGKQSIRQRDRLLRQNLPKLPSAYGFSEYY